MTTYENSNINFVSSFNDIFNYYYYGQTKWYWLKVTYKQSPIEVGTITIGGNTGGLMKGIGTKFTETLRGQPNFPSKIK